MPRHTTESSAAFSHGLHVICDDRALIHLQHSTQWDSLAHVGSPFDADGTGPSPTFHNGFRGGRDTVGPSEAADADQPSRAKRLGIERLAEKGMRGRAVMIDLRAHLGDGKTRVGYDRLARTIEADRVVVEPGDMVCLHTGFSDRLIAMNGTPDPEQLHDLCAALDGRDPKLLDWITSTGLLPADRRELRGGGLSGRPRTGLLRDPAAARALPVQARR